MVFNIYDWADHFDYGLILLLLKLTEGNSDLRSQFEEKFDDWLLNGDCKIYLQTLLFWGEYGNMRSMTSMSISTSVMKQWLMTCND